MKKILLVFIFLSFYLGLKVSKAQCLDFASSAGIASMDTAVFLHDGRFNAIKLKQGDDIYIYKSFYAQEQYRIVVVGEKGLGELKFEITDFKQKNVIFSNEKTEKFFDFTPDISQRAIIHITIPASAAGKVPQKGCVAVMFGLKKL